MRVWIGNGCISMCADSLASAQDSSNAKALAFNKDVRTRCITLEGDDFNPSGTLTGEHTALLEPFI